TLDSDNVKELFAEDLKNVKHKSKGRIHKKFNNKLQRRVYRDVLSKLFHRSIWSRCLTAGSIKLWKRQLFISLKKTCLSKNLFENPPFSPLTRFF
ncbi:MAG: hypothetical protein DRH24_15025, partial [Deltaproteobacteria bacterium]